MSIKGMDSIMACFFISMLCFESIQPRDLHYRPRGALQLVVISCREPARILQWRTEDRFKIWNYFTNFRNVLFNFEEGPGSFQR